MNRLRAKLIHYYLINRNKDRKKGDKGFTLLELLIVIVILGIISAIALPGLLNQVSKAKETEAKQNLSTFNKYQQVYFLENSQFTDKFDLLAMGNLTDANSETQYYDYELEQFIADTRIKIRASPKDNNLREYSAGIRKEINSIGIPVMINLACRNNKSGVSNLSINIVDGTCTNGEKLYGNGV